MNKNDRSREELLSVLDEMTKRMEPVHSKEAEEFEKLFVKMSPVVQAREKVLMCLKLVDRAKNLPSKEAIDARRVCLNLHANIVMLESSRRALVTCMKFRNFPPEVVMASMISLMEDKLLEATVRMAEIIESIHNPKELP